MKSYLVNRSKISGSLAAPPSKSHTLRAILFASLAKGKSQIHRYLKSPDTFAMIEACRQLGAIIAISDSTLEITGVSGKPTLPNDVIDAGNSGQVLRFVAAITALIDGYSVFTGDSSIRFNRPLNPLIQGLTALGAECISTKADGHAPLIVKGPIAAGKATLKGSDSQPVSALLIASAFLAGETDIHVIEPGEKPWVALTLAWFDRLGIPYHHQNFEHYTVKGGNVIEGFDFTVPGDFSSIAYPMAAAILTQSSLVLTPLDFNDSQGDKKIIEVLKKMGASIEVNEQSLLISPSKTLKGCDIDVNDLIDALPILAVVACFARGTTRLLNAAIARTKESDRLHTISQTLKAMGAEITEGEDSLTIVGSTLHGATVQSHEDHRIAMSLTVAGLAAASPTQINHIDCIAKSYPEFYEDLRSIGAQIELIS